jgi:formylglycine-generating enzyme required for sulfatase activity
LGLQFHSFPSLEASDDGREEMKILNFLILWASIFAITLPASAGATEKTFTNSIGMKFVLIPGGKFRMGSPDNESKRFENESPQHEVEITKPFYLGQYEVTQGQWKAVMGSNPANFKGDDLPVEQVSWEDVQEFIKRLNEKEKTNRYRLPTEAEWEYACRAGTHRPYR